MSNTRPHRVRRAGVMLGALMATVFLLTMSVEQITNDAVSSSLASWRIATTGAPWLEGVDYSRFESNRILWIGEAENGRLVAFRSPGSIALAVPAYWVADLLGVSAFSIVPGSVTAALTTALAMSFLFLGLQPRLGPRRAAACVLALALTTPVWTVAADSLWTHPVTLLGIAGMAWAAARERWWLVGLFGGVAIWGRLHTAVIVAVLGLGIGLARRNPRVVVWVGSVSAACLALACAWGRWMYGTWSPAGGYSVSGYTEGATDLSSPVATLVNHAGLWVAPDRGLLIWTPALLLLAPSLVRSWRTLPDWSRWLALGGLVYTLVQGQLNAFMGGSGFFGYRLTLEMLVCVFPAVALSLPRAGEAARRLLGPVLGLQFSAIVLGAANDGGVLPETSAWTRNSYVHVLAEHPALTIWPLTMMALGLVVATVLRRRSGLSRSAEASGVSARDDLDRV